MGARLFLQSERGEMSAEFVSRIVGMLLLATGGAFVGVYVTPQGRSPYYYASLFLLLGALTGLVLTPYLTVRPFAALKRRLREISSQQMLASVLGLVTGLIIAALFSSTAFSMLPPPFSQVFSFASAVICGFLGVMVMSMHQAELLNMVRGRWMGEVDSEGGGFGRRPVLLDTSVIIDGRIADISRTGFIEGEMLVPRFVLNELQRIADSPDLLRRNRGRRGLEMLRHIQNESITPVRILDMDVEGGRDVDDKLVLLAKRLHAAIVTNDYNLNRVAELQGLRVLNINELANAVKALFLPGESLVVKIVQEGKEVDQGVGYLDDGTMVVVENGKRYIGQELQVVVTKVLQTAAGRMLFARPE